MPRVARQPRASREEVVMVAKVEALAGPAGAGTLEPLATSPVVGTPAHADDPVLPPGSEPLVAGELQVARCRPSTTHR